LKKGSALNYIKVYIIAEGTTPVTCRAHKINL